MDGVESNRQFDSGRLPVGDLAWEEFLDWAVSNGPTAEDDWIEVKGGVDPISKVGGAKIAKFVLGASNRRPDVAQRHLNGCAAFFIGIETDGTLTGAEPHDLLEIQKKVRPYLGEDGPHWELKRLAVENGPQVLVVVVDPPRNGDPMYVCKASGHEIIDGRIYFRDRGETREANSAEVSMLQKRTGATDATHSLDVEIVTPVEAFEWEPGRLDEVIAKVRRELLSALPSEIAARERAKEGRRVSLEAASSLKPSERIELMALSRQMLEVSTAAESMLRRIPAMSFLDKPEPRNEEEFREQVETYTLALRNRLPECPLSVFDQLTSDFQVRVTNTSDNWIDSLKIEVHIEGQVVAREAEGSISMPRAPRAWGPIRTSLSQPTIDFATVRAFAPRDFGPAVRNMGPEPSASAETTGSVSLTLSVPELRAQESVVIEGDQIIYALAPTPDTLPMAWRARARNMQGVLEGGSHLQLSAPLDITESLASALYASATSGELELKDDE